MVCLAVPVAQTLVEYGLLSSIRGSLASARDRIEYYVGMGNSKYLLIGAIVALVLLFVRRRR